MILHQFRHFFIIILFCLTSAQYENCVEDLILQGEGYYNQNSIPPQICWVFWFGDEMSDNRKQCLQKIYDNIGLEVRLITEDNINEYLQWDVHPAVEYLSGIHKADYYRIYFLLHYGGTYTDIKCITDVTIENKTFGKYKLERDKAYTFNLETLGRDPVLKRNNVFMAKRQVYALINKGKLKRSEDYIKAIAQKI